MHVSKGREEVKKNTLSSKVCEWRARILAYPVGYFYTARNAYYLCELSQALSLRGPKLIHPSLEMLEVALDGVSLPS